MELISIKTNTIQKSSNDYQHLVKRNGQLQALVTELRYHCEVYKLGLRSINKILKSHHHQDPTSSKDTSCSFFLKSSARQSYHNSIVSLSQRKALEKISGIVHKAKTFINGYSLLEKTNLGKTKIIPTDEPNEIKSVVRISTAEADPAPGSSPASQKPMISVTDPNATAIIEVVDGNVVVPQGQGNTPSEANSKNIHIKPLLSISNDIGNKSVNGINGNSTSHKSSKTSERTSKIKEDKPRRPVIHRVSIDQVGYRRNRGSNVSKGRDVGQTDSCRKNSDLRSCGKRKQNVSPRRDKSCKKLEIETKTDKASQNRNKESNKNVSRSKKNSTTQKDSSRKGEKGGHPNGLNGLQKLSMVAPTHRPPQPQSKYRTKNSKSKLHAGSGSDRKCNNYNNTHIRSANTTKNDKVIKSSANKVVDPRSRTTKIETRTREHTNVNISIGNNTNLRKRKYESRLDPIPEFPGKVRRVSVYPEPEYDRNYEPVPGTAGNNKSGMSSSPHCKGDFRDKQIGLRSTQINPDLNILNITSPTSSLPSTSVSPMTSYELSLKRIESSNWQTGNNTMDINQIKSQLILNNPTIPLIPQTPAPTYLEDPRLKKRQAMSNLTPQ